MARRFIDTNLVEQNWYQDLEPKFKCLWIHLLCVCDLSGVFEMNTRIMSAYIGDTVTKDDIFSKFGARVVPISDTKGIIIDFVYYQCGGELREVCPTHRAIIKKLKENGVTVEDLQKLSTHPLGFIPYNGGNATMKADPNAVANATATTPPPPPEETKIDRELSRYIEDNFMKFWDEYPRHDAKAPAMQKFARIIRTSPKSERDVVCKAIVDAVIRQRGSEQWQKDNGRFIPMPSTWLNQRRWEDEGSVDTSIQSAESSVNVKALLSGVNI